MIGDPLDSGVDILKVAEKFAPEVVYLRLRELEEEREALVEVARAAREAWNADERAAGAWTATGEQAVKDLASALDDIGAALARLDAER